MDSKEIVGILEQLKQEDHELWIRTSSKPHLSEEQWDWLIKNFEEGLKFRSTCKNCRHNGSYDTDCPINWPKDDNDYCSYFEE